MLCCLQASHVLERCIIVFNEKLKRNKNYDGGGDGGDDDDDGDDDDELPLS